MNLYSDEAGCMTFRRGHNISRYFILCSVALQSDDLLIDLMRLRRELVWRNEQVGDCFHAATDRQSIRDEVFATLLRHDFSVQATILEKSKAHAGVTTSEEKFYRYSWYRHFNDALSGMLGEHSKTLLSAAAIGTRKQRAIYKAALDDAAKQHLKPNSWTVDFVPASNDLGVQVADYCAWAIQRKWESPEQRDQRSYELIRGRITHESDVWADQTKTYY